MVRSGSTRRNALQLWLSAGAIVVLATVLAVSITALRHHATPADLGVIAGLLLAAMIMVAMLYRLDRLDRLDGIRASIASVVVPDEAPDDHARDVARLAAAVGHRLGLEGGEAADLVQAAELHDVGKVAIPDSILQKPGPLAPDEQQFMRRHTLIGENILSAASALAGVGRLVRSSHERYDGTGYPDRLAREEIPLASRIIFVCDAYDAMTTDRPYRKAMNKEDAVAELRRCANTQFDPAVVDAFIAELGAVGAPVAAGVGS
jgi:HD-GYP domain-containing protein (c-di-GMP phosphodiesterase class II)